MELIKETQTRYERLDDCANLTIRNSEQGKGQQESCVLLLLRKRAYEEPSAMIPDAGICAGAAG